MKDSKTEQMQSEFTHILDALKECEALTPEWDLYWALVHEYRVYAETKKRNDAHRAK
jgi:uncharacterized protein YjaG (DUF416 family)